MLTTNEIRRRLDTRFSGTLTLKGKRDLGSRVKDKRVFNCATHGNFVSTLGHVLAKDRKHGCPKCVKSTRTFGKLDSKTYQKRLPKTVALVGDYCGMNVSTDHKCIRCSSVWSARPSNLVYLKSGCPYCARGRKKVLLSGRRLKLRGYEPQGIRWLLRAGLTADDILTDSEDIPTVEYLYKGVLHKYTPDLFLWKYNVLVEIKSLTTLGCTTNGYSKPEEVFQTNVAKARACIEDGYKFLLLVMSKEGRRYVLPQNWYTYSSNQLHTWATKMGLVWELNHLETKDLISQLAGTQEDL